MIIGHTVDTGAVYSHDPEVFFHYDSMSGLVSIRKVPVEVKLSRSVSGFVATVLDNPDVTPSSRYSNFDKLPSAAASTQDEAVGKLIRENPDLFRVVIR